MSIALLIADDHPVVRESLHVAFSGTDIEIVGKATTSGETLMVANDPRVDVLLLDVHWQLDGELTSTADGIELLRIIRSARRDLAILMYSADGRADSVARCRRLGANGYLVKGVDDRLLGTAVRAVDGGGEIWPGLSADRDSSNREEFGSEMDFEQ